MRQPEWMATMPPERLRYWTRAEAGRFDHRLELFLAGKGADAFDQIAIGLAIAGDDLADRRDGGKGIGIIDACQAGHIDMLKIRGTENARRASIPDRPRTGPCRYG